MPELGAGCKAWDLPFIPFVPACLLRSGTLMVGVTRRTESAVLIWGFAAVAPTQAVPVGFKADCSGSSAGGLTQICQWHLCVLANAAKPLMGFCISSAVRISSALCLKV